MPELNKEKIKDNLDAVSVCASVPVTLYSPEGKILAEYLPKQKFCQFFSQYLAAESECFGNMLFSLQLSYEMGEPYIYYCPVGLVHIAVPVICAGRFVACAVAGPLIMGESDERLLNHAMHLNHLAIDQLSKIALFTAQMKRFGPVFVQKLSNLMFAAVVSPQGNTEDYALAAARTQQNLMMGEQIQQRKHNLDAPLSTLNYRELKDRFIKLLTHRKMEQAKECLKALINELVLVKGGNFDSVKIYLLETFLSLTSAAIDSGVSLQKAFGAHLDFFTSIDNARGVEELSRWADAMLEEFAADVFTGLAPRSSTMAKALEYLRDHYMEKVSLRDLAQRLFVSDSYLSKLFRQELDLSYTSYLNQLRIGRSMDLMQNSELSLMEISGLVGFGDQSYFTKVFKRVTGKTPKQYKAEIIKKGAEKHG